MILLPEAGGCRNESNSEAWAPNKSGRSSVLSLCVAAGCVSAVEEDCVLLADPGAASFDVVTCPLS